MHFFPSNYTHWYKNTVAFWTSDASKKVLTDIKYTTVFSDVYQVLYYRVSKQDYKESFHSILRVSSLIIYEKNLY